ncbi:hypothetical protein [Siminovitchia fortis]|nr:hypothetical protein [Siminovitchia fortis]
MPPTPQDVAFVGGQRLLPLNGRLPHFSLYVDKQALALFFIKRSCS